MDIEQFVGQYSWGTQSFIHGATGYKIYTPKHIVIFKQTYGYKFANFPLLEKKVWYDPNAITENEIRAAIVSSNATHGVRK